MASYIEGALIKDEKIIYAGHVSLWSMAPLIIIGALTLPFLGLGIVFLMMAYFYYKTAELAFTNKRVIAKFGLISRKTIELNISKVESIQVHQGILGGIFNFGTLIISGAGNPQAPIVGISDPMSFRRALLEYQDGASETQVAEKKSDLHANVQGSEQGAIRKFCNGCGSVLLAGSQFCGDCGSKC